jgi:energy-coupling factor transport system permease protein
VAEGVCLLLAVCLSSPPRAWLQLLTLVLPVATLVFGLGWLSLGLDAAIWLTVRLCNLLSVSCLFFRALHPNELGAALEKAGIPYSVAFMLTTALRYVPLMAQRLRHISEAQRARGIDLRPRVGNVPNFLALLMPLLVQALLLADELALAMEARGFGRKGRTARRGYRLRGRDYAWLAAAAVALGVLAWWELGAGRGGVTP